MSIGKTQNINDNLIVISKDNDTISKLQDVSNKYPKIKDKFEELKQQCIEEKFNRHEFFVRWMTEIAKYFLEEETDIFKSPWEYMINIFDKKSLNNENPRYADLKNKLAEIKFEYDLFKYPEKYKNENCKKAGKKKIKKSVDVLFNKLLNKKSFTISKETGIFVCFALKLNKQESIEFVQKACLEDGFNVRNFHEYVYLYCLHNSYSFQRALDIVKNIEQDLGEDSSDIEDSNIDNNEIANTFSFGNTTQLLLNSELDFDNCTDEDVIEYVLGNQDKFLGYRKSIIKWCLWLRIQASLQILTTYLDSKQLDEANQVGKGHPKELIVLNKFINELSSLPSFDKKRVEYPRELEKYMLGVYNLDKDTNNESFRFLLREFWPVKDFFSIQQLKELYNLCVGLIPSVYVQKWTIGRFADSVCSEQLESSEDNKADENNLINKSSYKATSLLASFPDKKILFNIDSKFADVLSGNSVKFNNYETRKAIIALYYWTYIFAWYYYSDIYDMSYEDFVTELNTLLEQCCLTPLYPANPYDYLVLISVDLMDGVFSESKINITEFKKRLDLYDLDLFDQISYMLMCKTNES